MKFNIIALLLVICTMILACNNPREIEAEVKSDAKEVSSSSSMTTDVHEVIVMDILNTSNYTYLQVKEKDRLYWIAVPGQEVLKGETYYYKGGLMQKDFKSKEFDRVFETIYLVSVISKTPPDAGSSIIDEAYKKTNQSQEVQTIDPEKYKGGVPIADLMANSNKYSGQVITVKGVVIKVNNQIMNRNWLHIQDGTTEAKTDLTVTTQEIIEVGSEVTLEGKIAVNKDFGAGYKYAVIMEEARLK